MKRLVSIKGIYIGLAALLAATSAYAQTPPATGNLLNTIPRPPPRAVPLPAQPVSPTLPNASTLPHPSEKILARELTPKRFDISGVKSIPFIEIAKLFGPFVGKKVTLKQIVEATAQATKIYRDAGYVLSFAFVPTQDFQNGIIKITIVEGYLSAANIEGDSGHSEDFLRGIADPLLKEKPLTKETFERQTMLMSRIPGIQAKTSAKLPTTLEGGTPLGITATHHPVQFSLGGDLRGPIPRIVANASFNDVLWGGSQFNVSTLLRPYNRERFWAGSYVQLLNSYGTTAQIDGSDFRKRNSVDGLPGVDEQTRQKRLGFSVSQPLYLRQKEIVIFTGGIYGLDHEKQYKARKTEATFTDQEKVRTLYGRLAWTKTDGQGTDTAFSVTLAQGINGLGAELKRFNNFGGSFPKNPTRLDFTRTSFDASQRFRFGGWGAGVMLGGQYSAHILPDSERVSFGGNRYGRGYQSGEASADSGLGAGLEVNYRFILDMEWLKHVEPYFLVEGAHTWARQEELPSEDLRSASIGTRFTDGDYYTLDMAVSKPTGDRGSDNPKRLVNVSALLSYRLDF